MKIIDISNPEDPQLISEYIDDDREFIRFYVEDEICFVTCLGSGFKALNVSDPSNIIELDSYNDGGYNFNLKIVGDTAFVSDGGDGLEILDISNASDIKEIGNYSATDAVFGIDIFNDYAFIGVNEVGLVALNISDLTNPTKIGEFDVDNIVGVTYHENVIYLSMHGDGLLILGVDLEEIGNAAIGLYPLLMVIPLIFIFKRKKDGVKFE